MASFKLPFGKERTPPPSDDLGFGNRITGDRERLLDQNGDFNVKRIGARGTNPYQDLVEMVWWKFFCVVLVFFIVTNALFAMLLMLAGPACLNGMSAGSWSQDFAQMWFFSVQTFTTVGYGSLSPACTSSNLIASAIALIGLMAAAIMTGLLFARFAKPKSQLLFSKNAIIAPYKDGTSFQFRLANGRNNRLINLDAKVTMSWVEQGPTGIKTRKFARLNLEREKVVMLPLNWNIVHPIDEESPLFGKTAEDLAAMVVEMIILIEAFDETFSQTIFANYSYCDEEFLWNVRFKPMYYPDPAGTGKTILDMAQIDEVVPAA